jgi:hypothetical protein
MGLWIWCGNKHAVFTIGWKFAKDQKRHGRSSQMWKSCWQFFFDIKGVVHYEFLHQGQTVNRQYYCELLKCLRENVRRKRPQLWRNNFWFLHHNNVPAHTLLLIYDFLVNTNTTVLPQPPYSPDMVLADFFLFHKLKSTWRMLSSGMWCHVEEAICSSKTSVYTRSSWRHTPEDGILHNHRHENLNPEIHLKGRRFQTI